MVGGIAEGEMVDCFRRESGILVNPPPSIIFEDWLEEVLPPGLTFATSLGVHLPPHVGDNDDVPDGVVTVNATILRAPGKCICLATSLIISWPPEVAAQTVRWGELGGSPKSTNDMA